MSAPFISDSILQGSSRVLLESFLQVNKYLYHSTMTELVPEGAWDTHIHVFDPEKFPYAPKRSYTPKAAQMSEYPTNVTGCRKIVIVHASMQGSSPAPLVASMKLQETELVDCTLRGLATIDPHNITDAELDTLHKQGVRGTRFHKMAWGHGAQSGGADIMKDIQAAADRIARLGWIIDVFCPVGVWAHMADFIRNLDPRIKVLADHFGGTFPGEEKSEDFQVFLQLVKEKRVSVKLSGFERLYHGHAGKMDVLEPIARAIIEAGPDQIVFGSDWPHTQLGEARKGKTDEQRLNEIEGFRDVPDEEHIRTLRRWIKDDSVWHKLFVINSEKMFN